MQKEKIKYKVFAIDTLDYGDGRVDHHRTFLGTTFATSPAQAVQHIRFRYGIDYQSCFGSLGYDGYRRTTFEAKPV